MANRATGIPAPQLLFNGSEEKYDLWETRFLSYLHILKLKHTILQEPAQPNDDDRQNNADCYAETVRLIDNKSLSLIRHEATDDGRKALKILREHYAGKSKPRIINMYTSLIKLHMEEKETVTDYLIRPENIITALREAGETLSDGLIVAMVLGGLPDSFKPLAVHVTQNEDNVTFADFKRRLRVYEESEKMKRTEPNTDNVMKMHVRQGKVQSRPESSRKDEGAQGTKMLQKGVVQLLQEHHTCRIIVQEKAWTRWRQKIGGETRWRPRFPLHGQVRPERKTTRQHQDERDYGGRRSNFPHRE